MRETHSYWPRATNGLNIALLSMCYYFLMEFLLLYCLGNNFLFKMLILRQISSFSLYFAVVSLSQFYGLMSCRLRFTVFREKYA